MNDRFKKFAVSTKRFVLLAVLTATIIIGGIYYWQYSNRYVSTEDSYINANIIQITPQVTGKIDHLYILNNQFVRQGQLLFTIDQRPFIVDLSKAKANLASAQANWQNANVTAQRIFKLVEDKLLAPQAKDDAIAKLKIAEANVAQAKAELAQADLNLQYTRVIAPVSGWITNAVLQTGNIIAANQPLFALVSNQLFWVDANFKETDLAKIRVGQRAIVVVDSYPDYKFQGSVESISYGSGTAFSLLPPQNATGNWVKVTQRVPVKVIITNANSKHPLRIGTSATVTVNLVSLPVAHGR